MHPSGDGGRRPSAKNRRLEGVLKLGLAMIGVADMPGLSLSRQRRSTSWSPRSRRATAGRRCTTQTGPAGRSDCCSASRPSRHIRASTLTSCGNHRREGVKVERLSGPGQAGSTGTCIRRTRSSGPRRPGRQPSLRNPPEPLAIDLTCPRAQCDNHHHPEALPERGSPDWRRTSRCFPGQAGFDGDPIVEATCPLTCANDEPCSCAQGNLLRPATTRRPVCFGSRFHRSSPACSGLRGEDGSPHSPLWGDRPGGGQTGPPAGGEGVG